MDYLQETIHLQHIEELRCANSKIRLKEYLQHSCIPTPRAYDIINGPVDLNYIAELPDEFVFKPDIGAQGRGVMILKRNPRGFGEPNGNTTPHAEMLENINRTMSGKILSRNINRAFIVEETVKPHPDIKEWSGCDTMTDFRFFFAGDEFLYCRVRVPTKASGGYGNVGKGAFVVTAGSGGEIIKSPHWKDGWPPDWPGTVHPETNKNFLGRTVPMWNKMIEKAQRPVFYFRSPLVCVDGCLDENDEFMTTEITLNPSVRPLTGRKHLYETVRNSTKVYCGDGIENF